MRNAPIGIALSLPSSARVMYASTEVCSGGEGPSATGTGCLERWWRARAAVCSALTSDA